MRTPRTDIAASVLAQMQPWSREAEDLGVAAWRALDSFTSLSAAELRQERRALVEMRDMIERALATGKPEQVTG